jgi:hypothetical protein
MCAVAAATGKSGGVLIRRASRLAVRERITSGTFNELFKGSRADAPAGVGIGRLTKPEWVPNTR